MTLRSVPVARSSTYQFIVANERHEAALAADRGVELGSLGVGQAAHLPGEVGEVDVAVERHEQRLAVGRPVVGDDPGQIGDAGALALHPLGFAQAPRRWRISCCRRASARRRWRVDRPQIVALEVVGAAAQQRDQLAVGRQLAARAAPGRSAPGWRTRARASASAAGWDGAGPGAAVEVSKAASPANRRA